MTTVRTQNDGDSFFISCIGHVEAAEKRQLNKKPEPKRNILTSGRNRATLQKFLERCNKRRHNDEQIKTGQCDILFGQTVALRPSWLPQWSCETWEHMLAQAQTEQPRQSSGQGISSQCVCVCVSEVIVVDESDLTNDCPQRAHENANEVPQFVHDLGQHGDGDKAIHEVDHGPTGLPPQQDSAP